MLWGNARSFAPILGGLALILAQVCSGQSPGFINFQPSKLDLSPYMRAEDQIYQMRAEMAREAARRRAEETQNRIQQVKVYYASAAEYPSSLNDGWYEVWTTDNMKYCDKGKVYVSGNKVTQYYAENFYSVEVSLSTSITAGKCMVQLGDKGAFFDLYFLDVISDPSKRVPPPLQPGTVSFWGEYRRPTKVYIDDEYVGTLDTYFNERPSCLTDGTLDVDLKPGEYQIRAEAGTKRWTNSVTVQANGCVVVNVSRR